MKLLSWLFQKLDRIDSRVIYFFVALAIGTPLVTHYSLPPNRMPAAQAYYDQIEKLTEQKGKIVLISADWGPGGIAENRPQTELAIEHLLRRRIPFAMISTYPLATPFLESLPQQSAHKLERELPSEKWEYGVDWVNLGYRPNGFLMIQGLAKATDLHTVLEVDANGTPVADIPLMKNIHTIRDISMLIEVTGLVGVFNNWIQFFQTQDYRPPFLHGCTSITIPEAYNFFAAGQIVGLHEGIAGAASYELYLNEAFPNRVSGDAIRNNTSIAIAQILIVVLVVLGNFGSLGRWIGGRMTGDVRG